MSFLGAGFLVGLAGIILPLAIHIFGKRKKVVQPWGAMRFLEQAKPNWKRRTLRLQDLIVLLLRIAAVTLLALAFARPVYKQPLPPTDVNDAILIVDRSPSTELGADTKNNYLADQIIDQTSKLLDLLPADTRIRLYVNGTRPGLEKIPAVSEPSLNESRNRAAWIASLETLRPDTDTLDWSEAVKDVLARNDLPTPLSREVLIIADAAKHGWPDSNSWSDLKTETPISIVSVGADHSHRRRANLSVDRLDTDQKRIQSGKKITLRATISNRGNDTASPATVRWVEGNGERLLAEDSVPKLHPGDTHEVVLKRAFPEAGPMKMRFEIDTTDALSADNKATKDIEVIDRIPVAVFIDNPPDTITDPDVRFAAWTFAAAAGHPESIAFGEYSTPVAMPKTGQSDPLFQLSWFTPNQLSTLDLDKFKIMVWSVADSSKLSRQTFNEKIRPFVANGGGLWLRPPDNVIAKSFNEVFFPHEYGLSPAGIPPTQRVAEDDPFGLRPPEEDAPNLFSKAAFSALEELQAKRHISLTSPLPQTSRVYLEFEGGRPFVIRRQLNKGTVILTTLDTAPGSGNLAACIGYVPFVRELLWNLADTPDENGAAPGIPGESEISAIPRNELERINKIEGIKILDPDDPADLASFRKRFDRYASQNLQKEKNYELREIRSWLFIGLLAFLILEVLMAHHLLSRRRSTLSS